MGEVGWVEGALGCELVVDRKGGEREMGWTARGAQIGLAPRFPTQSAHHYHTPLPST